MSNDLDTLLHDVCAQFDAASASYRASKPRDLTPVIAASRERPGRARRLAPRVLVAAAAAIAIAVGAIAITGGTARHPFDIQSASAEINSPARLVLGAPASLIGATSSADNVAAYLQAYANDAATVRLWIQTSAGALPSSLSGAERIDAGGTMAYLLADSPSGRVEVISAITPTSTSTITGLGLSRAQLVAVTGRLHPRADGTGVELARLPDGLHAVGEGATTVQRTVKLDYQIDSTRVSLIQFVDAPLAFDDQLRSQSRCSEEAQNVTAATTRTIEVHGARGLQLTCSVAGDGNRSVVLWREGTTSFMLMINAHMSADNVTALIGGLHIVGAASWSAMFPPGETTPTT